MTRAWVAAVAVVALAPHAGAETRVITSHATVTGTYQAQPLHAVSNAVVATVHAAAKPPREDARQLPEKDTDKGKARGPGRVPAAKRTR